jgi:SAM-dependent methyltransferase
MQKVIIGINDLPSNYLFKYYKSKTSLFRNYQYILLKKLGVHFKETVIEIGGETHYQHHKFFPYAKKFICTNVGRDYDIYLDITRTEFDDNSQDAYICISVLEHIPDIQKAIYEIKRTLKPGGKLLLVVPFAHAFHDDVDFWRLSESAYFKLFDDFKIEKFIHLGGIFSTCANAFQRPKGKITLRYLIYKTIGLIILFFGKFFEKIDTLPIGYGIYAIKK